MIKLHGQKQFVETMAYFRLTHLEGRPIRAGEAWGQALGEQSKFDVEWGHKPSKATPKDVFLQVLTIFHNSTTNWGPSVHTPD